jgi:YHS domain-containing protein
LNEKRQDPITGDLIAENDEIVFCQECKSAFLKSSWEYLSEKHCNQNKTLANFPVKKILNLKSKRQYFKAYLHSISDWKQFDTQIKTLPWVLSSLDTKEYEEEQKNISYTLVIFLIFTLLIFLISVIMNSYYFFFAILGSIPFILLIRHFTNLLLNKKSGKNRASKKPTISIERDQIVIFMPYKEQKVTLAKYKVEEIELIPKENDNYKLRVSYKGGTIFFSMNLNQNSLSNLIETLYNWSNTVKIDFKKMSFGRNLEVNYLYAALDAGEENSNLLLP